MNKKDTHTGDGDRTEINTVIQKTHLPWALVVIVVSAIALAGVVAVVALTRLAPAPQSASSAPSVGPAELSAQSVPGGNPAPPAGAAVVSPPAGVTLKPPPKPSPLAAAAIPDSPPQEDRFFKGGELAGGHSDSVPVQLKVREMIRGEIIAVRNQSLSWSIADFGGRTIHSFGETDTRAGFYYAAESDGQHYVVITNPNKWSVGTNGYNLTYSVTLADVVPGKGSGRDARPTSSGWPLIASSIAVVCLMAILMVLRRIRR